MPLQVTGPWSPPHSVCSHFGNSVNRTKRFPWGPPGDIGEIISADSNINESGNPSYVFRCLAAVAIGIATYLVLGEGVIAFFPNQKGNPDTMRVMAGGLGAPDLRHHPAERVRLSQLARQRDLLSG